MTVTSEKTEYSNELIPRILRDIDDGVLALDRRGRIIYMNPQCRALLGIRDDALGTAYASAFFEDPYKKENDPFHQFILDAVYQKEKTHCGVTVFTDPQGTKKHLRVTSSFLQDGAQEEHSGIVTVISDVTEAEVLKKKRRDAATVFTCVAIALCVYLILLALLDFLAVNVPTKLLTQVINGITFVAALIIYKKTDFSPDELGLKLCCGRATFGSAAIIAASVVAALAGAKLLILRVSPDFFAADAPFWNWNIGLYSWISYVFTCILQEFLARSMIYGSIRKMFDSKMGVFAALVISSLLFSAVHIAHGFLYMMAAMLLLGSLGGLYEKHRNIWGVTVIHYVLGQAACCLGFLA